MTRSAEQVTPCRGLPGGPGTIRDIIYTVNRPRGHPRHYFHAANRPRGQPYFFGRLANANGRRLAFFVSSGVILALAGNLIKFRDGK